MSSRMTSQIKHLGIGCPSRKLRGYVSAQHQVLSDTQPVSSTEKHAETIRFWYICITHLSARPKNDVHCSTSFTACVVSD